jgi:hypothetical protein
MKWSGGVQHLEKLRRRVRRNGRAAGDGLAATGHPAGGMRRHTGQRHLDPQGRSDLWQVTLVVDLPVDEVAWLCHPAGVRHRSHATGLSRRPIVAMWRSMRAPLWNQHIRRPLLIWHEAGGSQPRRCAGLATEPRRRCDCQNQPRTRCGPGWGPSSREALEPWSPPLLRREQRRFSPGRLETVADALWHATQGCTDVLRASAHTSTGEKSKNPTQPSSARSLR